MDPKKVARLPDEQFSEIGNVTYPREKEKTTSN